MLKNIRVKEGQIPRGEKKNCTTEEERKNIRGEIVKTLKTTKNKDLIAFNG